MLGRDATWPASAAQPAGAGLPAERGRPGRDGRRRHLPGTGRRHRGRIRPAGRRRHASGSSRTARSSTPARTRSRRSRRLGVNGNLLGEPIDALTSSVADDPFDASDLADTVAAAIDGGQPASIEVDGGGATVLFRAHPAAPARRAARRAGAAAGRHRAAPPGPSDHEQGRDDPRDPPPGEEQPADGRRAAAAAVAAGRDAEARIALEESMRRVCSIALVHETLSSSIDEEVDFDEVVDRLLVMLAEVTGARGRVRLAPDGQLRRPAGRGRHPAGDGAHRARAERGRARLSGRRRRAASTVTAERGRGRLDRDHRRRRRRAAGRTSLDASDRLGLQIVRTLVSAELDGTVEFRRASRPANRGREAAACHDAAGTSAAGRRLNSG